MPVLLLARGDGEAKDLLRQVIEARYGISPPAIDNLEMDFKGRVRAKVGPITTWVPVEVKAYFGFPNTMRWDFNVKPVGVSLQRGVEAFDGRTYRHVRGGATPTVSDDERLINSLQRRLWAIAAVLLTPLGEHFVELHLQDRHTLEATNTQLQHSVTLHLRDNHTLDNVQVMCFNPDSGQEQRFSLRLSDKQAPVDDVMVPCKISAFWDDTPYFEIEPNRVHNSLSIEPAIFDLSNE